MTEKEKEIIKQAFEILEAYSPGEVLELFLRFKADKILGHIGKSLKENFRHGKDTREHN